MNGRRLRRRFAAVGVSLTACLAALAGSAAAAPPPAPLDLRVAGGEGWQADNDFRFDWRNPDPVTWATVHYRVSTLAGTVVLASHLPWDADRVEDIHVPGPGPYRAEVWLESASSERGAAVAAGFRFDDAAPGAIGLSLPGGWTGADKRPLLRLSHPAAPHPVSGVRGYAVVAGGALARPCAARDRCTAEEIDIATDGVGDDLTPLPDLPEGAVNVRAVAVSGAGVAGPVASGVVLVDRTPPAVTFGGIPNDWVSRSVTVIARAGDELSGMAGGGALTGIALRGATPALTAGDSASLTVSGEGAHAVAAHARDVAGNSSPPATAVVRIDRTPPRVAFAAALDRDDPELLAARVGDDLSGPDPARGAIGVRPRGSRRQFAPLPTAVAGNRLLARWDSDRQPPGLYEFQATAFDAAGNVTSSQLRADGAKLVLPAPLKVATRLTAGFGGSRLPAQTVRYGRHVTVGGTLSAGAAPLAGMDLAVTERFDDGSTPRRREIRTGPGGGFALRLAPGPGRRIELGFAGTRTLAASAAQTLEVKVRAGVRMRASAASARVGGRPLVFRGTVAGSGEIPATGKSVELQFKLPGLPWTQFRTVHTDTGGRFRYPYRFSDDDSRGVRFGFRAFVPAEPGWPYEPAASRPVFVTGR